MPRCDGDSVDPNRAASRLRPGTVAVLRGHVPHKYAYPEGRLGASSPPPPPYPNTSIVVHIPVESGEPGFGELNGVRRVDTFNGEEKATAHKHQWSRRVIRNTRAGNFSWVLTGKCCFGNPAGTCIKIRRLGTSEARIAKSAPPALMLRVVLNSVTGFARSSMPCTKIGIASGSLCQRRRSCID
jgi:hypothetical protein